MDDFFSFLEWLYYVFGFWLFFLSPKFRRAAIDRWRSRSGISHLETAFEIGLSTVCGAVTVWALLEISGVLGTASLAAV